MRQETGLMIFKVLLIVTIVIAGFGNAVLQLWNKVVPGIFGLRVITFWEAVGLLCLSWIFFGGWRGWGPGERRWSRAGRQWRQLTPEQRDQLITLLERQSKRPIEDGSQC